MNRIKELRTENKLTQYKLGELIGVSDAAINKYEKELMTPKIDKLEKMAEVFKVSVDYLMGLSDFKNEDEMNLYNEQFKQLSQYQSQQVNAVVSNIKSLLIELEKNQDEVTKQNVLESLTDTISYLTLYSSEDSKKIDNLITTLTYLFDGLRGIYSLRYKTDDEKNSYKNYLVLREQLIKNIDDFYNMNK